MQESNNMTTLNLSKDVQKLTEMMNTINFCMLTTTAEDGSLHSRPMSTNGKVEYGGNLWFFTYGQSHKVFEAQSHNQVNVSFSDIVKHNYVSLSGKAELVRDREKIKQLWEPKMLIWFPDGIDTADIALLKVTAEKAEYWNSPSSPVAQTIALFQVLTGNAADIGENKKFDLTK